ncbi:MAG: hypothetical protein V1646_04625 [bacterium]
MKKVFNFLGISFLLISSCLSAVDVIIVMGPSCSGKSTLAKALTQRLLEDTSAQWHLVALDDVINIAKEELPDYSSDCDLEYLVRRVNWLCARGKSVVVDTNNYSEDFEEQLNVRNIKKVLVYASLPVLLGRDDHRTKILKRDDKRAMGARYFVMDNFTKFFTLSAKSELDKIISILSKTSIKFALDFDPYEICKTDFYLQLIKSPHDPLFIYSRFKFDAFVDTGWENTAESYAYKLVEFFYPADSTPPLMV